MAQKIKTVGIVGAGFMGCQIASRAAVFGFTVRMFDLNPDVLPPRRQPRRPIPICILATTRARPPRRKAG